ncbi:hypothetical protein QAD02_022677 [Eretmocerus hayati]|uniref:Uncharacterized protein n=1 Tax=Eretmocerus hayati TaxID=131215 RepID=A0ACC2PUT5_9HYME|nr:hypothetical protein QAD02_022677 [Eretmocerus hayati]
MTIPRKKSVVSQCLAALVSNIVLLTIGNFSGYTSVLISMFHKGDAGVKVDENYIKWFSSYLFLPPVGAIVIGLVSQKFGSRVCMLIGMFMLSNVWLIFYFYAEDTAMLLAATGILAVSLVISPTMTYTAEISEPRVRGVILATSTLSMYFGAFLTVLLASQFHRTTVALINLGWSIVGFVMICFIPDSPHWLSSKGKCKEAQKALAWLRGWAEPEMVDSDGSHNGHRKASRISKSRNAASQCFAALAANIVKFSYGNFIGMTTLIVGDLNPDRREDAPEPIIHVTKSELTWFGSYLFMGPVGALLIGLVSKRIGSRRTLWLTSLLFSLSWLGFYNAKSALSLLAVQAIMGIIGATVFGPGITFIAEITQPHLRSALMACSSLSLILGTFYTVAVGSLMHWKPACLLCLPFPIVGFLAMCFIPETPHWLAARARWEEAGNSLAWLRGWTTLDQVSSELQQLQDLHLKSSSFIITSTSIDSSANRSPFKSYLTPSFLRPLSLITFVFFVHAFAGSRVLQTYALVIFKKVNAPLDHHLATVIFDAVRISGALTCIGCVHFTGKRALVFASLFGAAIAYFIVAISLVQLQPNTSSRAETWLQWLPPVGIIMASYATSSGIDKVASMLNAELFPARFRDVGAGLGMFVNSLMSAVTGKGFLYAVDFVGLPATFFTFSGACIVGLGSFYRLLPETEGKSLVEIERLYEEQPAADEVLAPHESTYRTEASEMESNKPLERRKI